MAGDDRFDLSGRSVIITGGGRGIGKVYAEAFGRAGARVVAADIDGKGAEEVARAIALAGGYGARRYHRHRRSAIGRSHGATACSSASAAIDVLINNASLMSTLGAPLLGRHPARGMGSGDGWSICAACILCCRAVFPTSGAQRRGKIVNISSSRVWDGTPKPAPLHHVEGRRHRLHPIAGARGRRIRHHRQRRHARPHAQRFATRLLVAGISPLELLSRAARNHARPVSGGSRRRRDVSRHRGQRLHDGPDDQRRRRQVDALTAPRSQPGRGRRSATVRLIPAQSQRAAARGEAKWP